MLEERQLNGDALAGAIAGMGDAERRRRMAIAARQLARPDAAQRIADRVEQLAPRLRSGQGGRGAG